MSVEKGQTRKRVPDYVSHFDEYASEVETVESYKGSLKSIVGQLKDSLEKGDQSVYRNIFLSYLISKITINRKVEVSDYRNGESQAERNAAVEAVGLSLDLADPIYYNDTPLALKSLDSYLDFVKNSGLKSMLKTETVERQPDRRIMPLFTGKEDLRKAEDLIKRTGGRPILAIILAHRGLRRGLDLFYDYRSKTDTPDSDKWAVRCSYHCFDTFPKVSDQEILMLREMAQGRQVAVIGPADVFPVMIHNQRKVVNRLTLARQSLELTISTSDQKVNIISVPLRQTFNTD